MTQHVVDELESDDVDDDHARRWRRFVRTSRSAPIELIHEITPVRQSRERIMKPGMVEGLLQIEPAAGSPPRAAL